MAHVSQESAEVEGVNSTIVVAVNATVASQGRVVESDLEVASQGIQASHKINFLLEDVAEGALDVIGETIVAADESRRAIKSDVTEQVVRAGQQHLQEAVQVTGKQELVFMDIWYLSGRCNAPLFVLFD